VKIQSLADIQVRIRRKRHFAGAIGGVYSLEGKNFEEIKNINFDRWRKRFIKKYE